MIYNDLKQWDVIVLYPVIMANTEAAQHALEDFLNAQQFCFKEFYYKSLEKHHNNLFLFLSFFFLCVL